MLPFRKDNSIISSLNFGNLKTILTFRHRFWQPEKVVFSLYILHIPLIKSTNRLKWKTFRVDFFRLNVSAADNALWKGEKLDYCSKSANKVTKLGNVLVRTFLGHK